MLVWSNVISVTGITTSTKQMAGQYAVFAVVVIAVVAVAVKSLDAKFHASFLLIFSMDFRLLFVYMDLLKLIKYLLD